MRLILLFMASGILLSSCKGSSNLDGKTSVNTSTRKKAVCGNLHIDMNDVHIDWYEENQSILSGSDKVLVLPKKYKVYSADSTQVVALFNVIASGKTATTVLPLPEPAGCQLFTLINNLKKGQKLSPGMIMAVGESQGQKLSMSYHYGDIVMHASWFDLEYEMITIPIKGRDYYIIYEKMAPPPPKQKDEKQKVVEPEIIEIRYDK